MDQEKTAKEKSTVTTGQLASLFGVNVRTIQRLTKDGVLPVISSRPYIYDTLDAVLRYIRYLNNRVENETRDEAYNRAEFEKLRAEANLRMTQDKRARYELRQLRAVMHNAADVENMTADLIQAVTEKLEALPDRIGPIWQPRKSAAEYSQEIETACFDMLNELACYNFEERTEEQARRDREQKKRKRPQREKGKGDNAPAEPLL